MKLFVTFIFSVIIFIGFGQLDSASIISVNKIEINLTDENGTSYQDSVLQVEIFVNDFDFLGEIIVSATEHESQYPLMMIKKSKIEIENAGLYNSINNSITMQLPIYEYSGSIDIRVVVRNFQGANLPILDTFFNY